jgi:DNA-directed RNA polymerase-5 subunit 1
MDDICLSPELDGTLGVPTFEDCLEQEVTEKGGGSWDNGPTVNSSWEQNASVENDSDNWGGWSNAAAAADTGAAKLDTWADQSAKKDMDGGGGNWGKQPADQGTSSWNVPETLQNDSADWGGWGTEKAKDKKTVSEEPPELNTWADQSAKKGTDGGGGNWGNQPADQGNSSWNVPVTVEDNSADWGGWGTEKGKDKKTVPEEPAEINTWADQSAKRDTDGGGGNWGNEPAPPSRNTWDKKASKPHTDAQNDSWGSVAAKTQTSTAEDVPWGSAQTSSAEPMDAQTDSWGNVATKAQTSTAEEKSWGNVAASPSDNAWNAAQGNENSDAKDPDSWDGWGSAQAKDSSTDNLNTNNSKGWKSDGWAAKENRRDQRDNPGRPPMRPDERPPRPRFELPAEAKKILHEIEPIVVMVRKIFRESW